MKHIRQVVFIAVLILFDLNLQAQSFDNTVNSTKKHKDSLFIWYGEKQKDGKFRTDNGATISFNPKTGEIKQGFSFGGGGGEFKNVVKELNNTDNAEKQLEKEYKDAGNDMKTYPIVQEAIELYEKLKEETKDVVLKDIDWGKNDELIGKKLFGEAGFENRLLNDYCPKTKPIYDDIMEYANKVRGRDKTGDFDLPVPPSVDYFNCWGCDKKKRDDYDSAVKHYVDHYFIESENQIKNILGIARELGLDFGYDLFGRSNGTVNSEVLGSKSHPNSCSFLWEAPFQLRKALYTIMAYEEDRKWALLQKYRKDVTTIVPVTQVCLGIERTRQLLGFNEDDHLLPELEQMQYNLVEKWASLLLEKNDYSKIADIPFILGVIRNYELLGGPEEEVDDYAFKLIKYNRFKVSIDFSFRLGQKFIQVSDYHIEGYLNAVVKTEKEQMDSTIPCLRWVPAGHSTGDKNMFLPVKLTNINWEGPGYSYIGTHDFFTSIDMHIHLYNVGIPDTLFLNSQFRPEPLNGYFWQTPGGPTYGWPIGPAGMGAALFQDVEANGLKIAAEAESGELQKKIGDVTAMQTQAKEMAQKLQALQKIGASPQEMAAQLNKVMQQGNKTRQPMSNVMPGNMVPFTIKFENNNQEPVNGAQNTFDAKTMNPAEAPMIQRAIMTVSIRNEPYKTEKDAENKN
ncbi:MAG: hypothetical protein Q8891_01120 [Bacteroidota bacterium]|nr:hypothetical protein [Bacteroidota bacterium]